jgi:hypothetical protein
MVWEWFKSGMNMKIEQGFNKVVNFLEVRWW